MRIYLAGEYYKNMGNAIKQIVWGGIVPDEVSNGTLFSKPSHNSEIPRRATFGAHAVRGGIPSIDENLLSRSNDGRKLEKRRYASDTLRGWL